MSRQKFWRQIRLPRKAGEANLPDKTYGQELSEINEGDMSYLLGINYDEMRAVAGEFDVRAEEAEQLVTRAGETSCHVLEEWLGMAADEYAAQSQSCTARMARVPEMLRHVAGALRITADLVQRAEEHARWELAQRMQHGGV